MNFPVVSVRLCVSHAAEDHHGKQASIGAAEDWNHSCTSGGGGDDGANGGKGNGDGGVEAGEDCAKGDTGGEGRQGGSLLFGTRACVC